MPQADQAGSGTPTTRNRAWSHGFFALTMIGLGILGLVQRDFTPTWSGVRKSFPARETLVYFCALVTLIPGLGLLWRRTALISSRVLLAAFAIWMVRFRIPVIFRAPTITGAWWAAGDTAAMMAACWVLYVGSAGDWDRRRLGFATGEGGLRIARTLYGLALIPFGIAHFTYLGRTTPLVPDWLPWHLAWAYFTGGAFVAAGVAVVLRVLPRLAAVLSTLQMAGFTVLVWVPIMLAHPTASDQAEFVGSWVLTAAAWVVADSYRGRRWIAVG